MKYKAIELEILKRNGKKALIEYRKANRIPVSTIPNKIIESKKYKKKYKEKFEEE